MQCVAPFVCLKNISYQMRQKLASMWRDPIVSNVERLLEVALQAQRGCASSDAIEFEARMGQILQSKLQGRLATFCATPAVISQAPKSFFSTAVAPSDFEKIVKTVGRHHHLPASVLTVSQHLSDGSRVTFDVKSATHRKLKVCHCASIRKIKMSTCDFVFPETNDWRLALSKEIAHVHDKDALVLTTRTRWRKRVALSDYIALDLSKMCISYEKGFVLQNDYYLPKNGSTEFSVEVEVDCKRLQRSLRTKSSSFLADVAREILGATKMISV